jgi:hypothetical protein
VKLPDVYGVQLTCNFTPRPYGLLCTELVAAVDPGEDAEMTLAMLLLLELIISLYAVRLNV